MILSEVLNKKSNDYSEIDELFNDQTGCHLYEGNFADESALTKCCNVSIVIPCYNAASTIELLLQSIVRQNFPFCDLEVVIVNDGSSDKVEALLKKILPKMGFRCVLVNHWENYGRSAARNTGAGIAGNDLLLFLDADVIPGPGTLRSHAIKHSFASNLLLTSFLSSRPLTPELKVMLQSSSGNDHINLRDDWRYYAAIEIDGYTIEISNVLCTDFWKQLGSGRRYYSRTLPEMVVSACLSIRKDNFKRIGGFCEEFVGWGREDVFLGVMAIVNDLYVVPDLNVLWQLDNGDPVEWHHKRQQGEKNFQRYRNLLEKDLNTVIMAGQRQLEKYAQRVRKLQYF